MSLINMGPAEVTVSVDLGTDSSSAQEYDSSRWAASGGAQATITLRDRLCLILLQEILVALRRPETVGCIELKAA
ncbi:hypothetical protein CCP2SC5_2110004 [Azospirillaceae bacterium]